MPARPFRILQVVAGMNRGGIETWLMSVLRDLDREQFHMDFLVHTPQSAHYDEEIRELGSQIIRCLHPSRPWRYGSQFRRALREIGPYDVVHSHVYWFSGYVVRLSHQEGVLRRIVHFHPQADLKSQSLIRRIYRKTMCSWISDYATGILTCSQATLAAFDQSCHCPEKPKTIMYPVVDLSPFAEQIERSTVRKRYDLPIDVPLVLYVARFFPHKNHHGLLQIAQEVNAQGKIAHFVMAGSHGPLLPELQGLVERRPDVSILTGIEDIAPLMQASDLFAFPSLNEGFGIVALEAQAAGLPVVATALPAIREALAPSLRPLTFQPEDLGRASSQIRAILADGVWAESLAEEGRQWAQQFSAQTSVDQLLHYYQTEERIE